jgi:hypothetical protein
MSYQIELLGGPLDGAIVHSRDLPVELRFPIKLDPQQITFQSNTPGPEKVDRPVMRYTISKEFNENRRIFSFKPDNAGVSQ